MTKTLTIADLLERNRTLAPDREPMPLFSEMRSLGLPPPKVVIQRMFNLKLGEGLVMRTPGGRLAPVLDSIVVLDTWVGVDEVMIIHHTDCGATSIEEEDIRAKLLRRAPESKEMIEKMRFGTFKDPYQSVKDDVDELRASPLLGPGLKDNTRGFVHDIKTGLLTEVGVTAAAS